MSFECIHCHHPHGRQSSIHRQSIVTGRQDLKRREFWMLRFVASLLICWISTFHHWILFWRQSLKFNFPMVKHFVVLTPKPRGHSGLTPKNPNAFTFWHSGRVQSQNGRAGITVFSQQKHAAKTTTSVTLWTDLYKGCFSAGANAILFIKSLKGMCNIPLTYTSWMFLCLQYLYRVWKRNHQEQQRHPSNGCIPASKRQNLPSSHAIHCAKMRSSRKWTKVRSLRKIRWRNERNENCWSNVPSNRIHVIKLVPQWQLFLNHFSSRLHINFNGLLMERRFWVYIYLSSICICFNIYHSYLFIYSISHFLQYLLQDFKAKNNVPDQDSSTKKTSKHQGPLKTPQGLRWEGTLSSGTLDAAVSCPIQPIHLRIQCISM